MADNRVSVQASSITKKSYKKSAFDSVLILTDKATFTDEFKVYQSLSSFLKDNKDDELVEAGTLLFTQKPRIKTVIVAKTDVSNTDVGVLAVKMTELDSTLDTDFFAVVVVSTHSDDKLIELAKYVETKDIFYSAYTKDSNVIATATTDLASRVKALNLRHTFVSYNETKRLDCAFVSRFFGEKIGLVSAKFLVLSGIEASKLSDNELTNLLRKNCNVYAKERKKYAFTKQGTTASNENIKSVAGEIFINVTCIEAIYEVLLNNSNISFNSRDIKKLTTALNTKLRIAQNQKIIAVDDAENGASILVDVTPLRASSKIEFDIKYLDAGTLKFVDLKFTAFKDETNFSLERGV